MSASRSGLRTPPGLRSVLQERWAPATPRCDGRATAAPLRCAKRAFRAARRKIRNEPVFCVAVAGPRLWPRHAATARVRGAAACPRAVCRPGESDVRAVAARPPSRDGAWRKQTRPPVGETRHRAAGGRREHRGGSVAHRGAVYLLSRDGVDAPRRRHARAADAAWTSSRHRHENAGPAARHRRAQDVRPTPPGGQRAVHPRRLWLRDLGGRARRRSRSDAHVHPDAVGSPGRPASAFPVADRRIRRLARSRQTERADGDSQALVREHRLRPTFSFDDRQPRPVSRPPGFRVACLRAGRPCCNRAAK